MYSNKPLDTLDTAGRFQFYTFSESIISENNLFQTLATSKCAYINGFNCVRKDNFPQFLTIDFSCESDSNVISLRFAHHSNELFSIAVISLGIMISMRVLSPLFYPLLRFIFQLYYKLY